MPIALNGLPLAYTDVMRIHFLTLLLLSGSSACRSVSPSGVSWVGFSSGQPVDPQAPFRLVQFRVGRFAPPSEIKHLDDSQVLLLSARLAPPGRNLIFSSSGREVKLPLSAWENSIWIEARDGPHTAYFRVASDESCPLSSRSYFPIRMHPTISPQGEIVETGFTFRRGGKLERREVRSALLIELARSFQTIEMARNTPPR